jgi:putative peptidoglycan binding protein
MSLTNTLLNWWYGLGGKYPETIRWDADSGQGSQGKTVAMWQTVLGIEPDGSFGPMTNTMTRAWQGQHGIDPDGVVGPLTWAAAMKGVGHAGTPPTGGPPPGTRPLPQAVANKAAITAFAIETLNQPSAYPMGSTNSRNIDGVQVMARIEPHTWTHRNGQLVTNLNPPIRGVTLYEIIDPAQFSGDDVVWRVSQHGAEQGYMPLYGGEGSTLSRSDAGNMSSVGSDAEMGCSDYRGNPKKYTFKR